MIDNSQLDVSPETTLPATPSADAEAAAFLKKVGENVRRVRAERGLTRKALSVRSNVSERFLAQLETGTGNASILVLRQIAEALGGSHRLPAKNCLAGLTPREKQWTHAGSGSR